MRIAVVCETSAGDKNKDIIKALEGRGHEIINAGMKDKGQEPELTYIETGLLSALLLHADQADFVVGGCGTGQGYLNSVLQYPNVGCGLIQEPNDAWLFGQINGGNCISLALNKGYGWAGDINLRFIFDRLFSVEFGCGYPPHRQESQQASRERLERISTAVHLSFDEILEKMEPSVVKKVLLYPGIRELLDLENIEDEALRSVLIRKYDSYKGNC